MKNTFTILLLFSVALCYGQGNPIRVNIGLDSLTNTKMKAELTGFSFDGKGNLLHVSYIVKKYQLDNSTPVNITGSETKRELLAAREHTFTTNGKWINTSTKAILTDTTGVTPKSRLDNYLRTKAINSYPGVVNGDPLYDLLEGILREIIAIKQASKQLP